MTESPTGSTVGLPRNERRQSCRSRAARNCRGRSGWSRSWYLAATDVDASGQRLRGNEEFEYTLAFSSDSRTLVTGTIATARPWNIDADGKARLRAALSGRCGSVSIAACLPDARHLFLCGNVSGMAHHVLDAGELLDLGREAAGRGLNADEIHQYELSPVP